MLDLLLLSYSQLFCEINSSNPSLSTLWQIMLSYQSKVVQFKVGDLLKMYDFQILSPLLLLWKSFFVKCSSRPKLFSSVALKISDFTPPLYFPNFGGGFNLAKRMETLQILSEKNWRQSPKMPSVFILEGGRPPPWPSWWGALSGWVPRTAWKCSWWKPSPCTADPCRYLTGRLKMGKWNSSESEISSENVCENSIWSESSCKGAIWDRATGAEKLKLKKRFWSRRNVCRKVIWQIGVGGDLNGWDDEEDKWSIIMRWETHGFWDQLRGSRRSWRCRQ